MAHTMRAAIVRNFHQPLQIEELPIPTVGPNQVLIQTEACGVCHTDLHAAEGDWPVKPTLPFVPGHEGVGRDRGDWRPGAHGHPVRQGDGAAGHRGGRR
jgi:propanol-preferring alcohol dehydrogenase